MNPTMSLIWGPFVEILQSFQPFSIASTVPGHVSSSQALSFAIVALSSPLPGRTFPLLKLGFCHLSGQLVVQLALNMKIFNWVQRRIRPSDSSRDGLVGNVMKSESIRSDADQEQIVLRQPALVEVLDGWKDSMLTIGTLGFDLVKPSEYSVLKDGDEGIKIPDQHQQQEEEDDNHEKSSNEEDEVNPLMYTTFPVSGLISDSDAEKPQVVSLSEIEIECVAAFDENPGGKILRGERTTLAELFLAESDQDLKMKADNCVDCTTTATTTMEPKSGKKKLKHGSKNGFPFVKKLKHGVGMEDSSKKIRHMVKKLLTRKIHPVQESKQCCVSDNGNHRNQEAGESVCLLQARPGPTI